MVYEKKKSGDPDFDDKQPADQHAGKMVTAPDGREVLLTEANGPVDRVTGQHVNMDEAPDERDNRPAPGEVATEPSEVQTYDVKDTGPQQDAGKDDAASEKPAVGAQSGDEKAAEVQAETAATAAKATRGRASNK